MLPEISVPRRQITVPSTGQKALVRPFLVKEEKLMLIALETDTDEAVTQAVRDVITNCSNGEIEADKLAVFDLEWLFLQLRARAKGEHVNLQIKCPNQIEGHACGAEVAVLVDLSKAALTQNPEHTKRVSLGDDVGVIMRYPNGPNLFVLRHLRPVKEQSVEALFALVADCIDMVFKGDQMFHAKDLTRDELMVWIENMPNEQLEKMVHSFFETMPTLRVEADYECPECGYNNTVTLEGLKSFFG